MIREEKAVKAVLIILVEKRKCLMFDMKRVQKSKFKEFEDFLSFNKHFEKMFTSNCKSEVSAMLSTKLDFSTGRLSADIFFFQIDITMCSNFNVR